MNDKAQDKASDEPFDPAQHEGNKHLDPLAPPTHEDFDWPLLYKLLGEQAETLPEGDREKLCLALRAIFRFIVQKGGSVHRIGQRAAALAWVVNPELWDGKSAVQVAEYLGINRGKLHRATAEARRRFGLCNAGQRQGWNFKAKS